MAGIMIRATELKKFCEEAFIRVGVPAEDAATMAFVLVEGDLRGVETHGTAKLPDIIALLQTGELNPRAKVRVRRETACTAVVDGDRCAAGLAAYRAMELAIKKAKHSALGAVTVRNVGRCGALATFTSMALEHNMIGFMTAQGKHTVPPFGGKTRLLNTSPWSFAVPAGEEAPIVLDMSSTVISHSRLALAEKEQQPIPLDWLLDKNGVPTSDPAEHHTGFQTWVGGYKGYGLAVVDQVLAGILGGAAVMGIAPLAPEAFERGHFFLAISVEAFRDVKEFQQEMDRFIRTLKSSERIHPNVPILLPGERSYRTRLKRLENGIPVRPSIWCELQSVAKSLELNLETQHA